MFAAGMDAVLSITNRNRFHTHADSQQAIVFDFQTFNGPSPAVGSQHGATGFVCNSAVPAGAGGYHDYSGQAVSGSYDRLPADLYLRQDSEGLIGLCEHADFVSERH